MEEEAPQFETTDIKKSKRRFGMNWKALVTVFVIIGIGAMLMTTDGGKKFIGQTFDFVRIGVGNFGSFISGFFSGSGFQLPIGPEQMPSGNPFLMSLVTAKESFYGQSYAVYNTSFEAKSLCEYGIRIDDIHVRTEAKECVIEAEEMRGAFEYTTAGTVKFDGEVSRLEIDNNVYTSTGKAIKLSFEVIPKDFVLVGLTQSKVTIASATGRISRLSPQGSIKSTEELYAEKLEISGFVGFIKLEEPNIKLQGTAVSVKGTGASSSFSW